MNTLTSGLEFFINEVENLPYDKNFIMGNYLECVIGSTIGWSIRSLDMLKSEQNILKEYFGVEKDKDAPYFSSYSYRYYSDDEWEVIQLFTSYIGNTISKNSWLKLARNTLERLNELG